MKMKTMSDFFANVRTVIALGVVCMLLFAVVSCDKAKEEPQQPDRVKGTIIGVHYGFMNTFYVQVDNNYPIGKTFYDLAEKCFVMYRGGAIPNVITIQRLEGVEILENGKVVRTPRISFSYRKFNDSKEDRQLFRFGGSVAICFHAPYPWYVVTEFQLLD